MIRNTNVREVLFFAIASRGTSQSLHFLSQCTDKNYYPLKFSENGGTKTTL
jgi:hypothetical protein